MCANTHSLHPKIKSERRISRTDIFELLFGDDEEAKKIAHREFDASYERYFGAVKPLEADARDKLLTLRGLGLRLGVLSNRARRFMAHEIYTVDSSGWHELFDTMVCGDDGVRRKPFPDLILKALGELGAPADKSCWYVGDSSSDVISGNNAGVTSIFYNGAGWDSAWIDKIFPGTTRYPHRPDSVITDLSQLITLAEQLIAAHSATTAA
jgi:phosphoglycolate phosphatase